jgi:hypothetical protein
MAVSFRGRTASVGAGAVVVPSWMQRLPSSAGLSLIRTWFTGMSLRAVPRWWVPVVRDPPLLTVVRAWRGSGHQGHLALCLGEAPCLPLSQHRDQYSGVYWPRLIGDDEAPRV